MARTGKQPITIPSGIDVAFQDGVLTVKGPKGQLTMRVRNEVSVEINPPHVLFSVKGNSKNEKAFLGTTYALTNSMIKGVTEGYAKVLEIEGVGYRANMEGSELVLALGFSHPVRFVPPEGITIKTEKNTIEVSGIDKEVVGQTAANIRALKKPEPYKGKGIRYRGEYIRRKAGKKASAG